MDRDKVRAEWQGIPAEERREQIKRRGNEHVLICFGVYIWAEVWWGNSVGDQGPVCFCYLSPFSATPLPILKPRGKAKPPVNLNRYNSCRPKQCTEGNKKETSVSRKRLGQCAREAAVNFKCGIRMQYSNARAHTHTHTHTLDQQPKGGGRLWG